MVVVVVVRRIMLGVDVEAGSRRGDGLTFLLARQAGLVASGEGFPVPGQPFRGYMHAMRERERGGRQPDLHA